MVDCVCKGGGDFFSGNWMVNKLHWNFYNQILKDSMKENMLTSVWEPEPEAGAGLLRDRPFYRKLEPVNIF